MNVVIVYESIWGNTASLARAVAQGFEGSAHALSTTEATPDKMASVDLLVLGAPRHHFGLASLSTLDSVRSPSGEPVGDAPKTARLFMREWLGVLEPAERLAAVFDTTIAGLEGRGGAPEILEAVNRVGYRLLLPAATFFLERLPVSHGPGGWVTPEELERARGWGVRLYDALTDMETAELDADGDREAGRGRS